MNAAALLALQQIDNALDALTNRRPRLPEVASHAAATAELTELLAQKAAVEERIAAAQAAIDGAESAAHALTTKRTRLEAQLKTVISPREAEALMNEIATLSAQRSELDDQELASLEEQAAAEEELASIGEREPALHTALAAAHAALAATQAVLDGEAEELHRQRAEAAVQLTAEELAAYEHARRQFGGVGVATLEGTRCSGCHLDLSPMEMDRVKAVPAGEPGECPQCGRYLVR